MKKRKEEESERKKENFTEQQKPNVDAEVYNNNKKCDQLYTYTYIPTSKTKTAQQIQSTADLPSNQSKSKNYIYQLRTKLTKAQTGEQN